MSWMIYYIPQCNYVGCCNDKKERKRSHKRRLNNPNDAKHNLKIYKYIRENNFNFNDLEFVILWDEIGTEQDAKELETQFMLDYDSVNNGTNMCYSVKVPQIYNKRNKQQCKNYYKQ